MPTACHSLPNDPAVLREQLAASQAAVAARDAVIATRDTEIEQLRGRLCYREAELEKLKFELARLKRMRFGRSSEKLDGEIQQLELLIEALETPSPAASPIATGDTPRRRPVRQALPDHLPRESHVHDAGCVCPDCGGALRVIGEDVTEILEYVPEHWKVQRHVRPKSVCGDCDTLVQAPAVSRPIPKSYAGPGLLAHVLVSKYTDHLPLYRQSRIYARDGVELDVSTLAGWVGQAAALVRPLVEAIGTHVMAGAKLHADDTPVPVLDPGRGRTKTGRLWTYVRDDRNSGDETPPAVRFCYTPDRKGERPRQHLKSFTGTLQADGYAGFHHLYASGTIHEAACLAHVRRKFFDVHQATDSPIAADILERIQGLYAVEAEIRGEPADRRCAARQSDARPVLDQLKTQLIAARRTISAKSALAGAIHYALSRWPALTRYCDDGVLEIDNNIAENALRCVALGRKNYLFAGADSGGERAASVYTLIGTALLNGVNPEAWLKHVL
ncbi:MAG: IS66 family transposase, partial [Salinisphaera sp.]|nr:IS66 family transposase [Salinisphaera sp.]